MIFYIHPDSEFTYCLCLLSGVEIQCQCQLAVSSCCITKVVCWVGHGGLAADLGLGDGGHPQHHPAAQGVRGGRPRVAPAGQLYISTQYLHNIYAISICTLFQVCCTDSFRKDVEGLKQQLDSLLCSRQARDTGICQVSTDDLCPH